MIVEILRKVNSSEQNHDKLPLIHVGPLQPIQRWKWKYPRWLWAALRSRHRGMLTRVDIAEILRKRFRVLWDHPGRVGQCIAVQPYYSVDDVADLAKTIASDLDCCVMSGDPQHNQSVCLIIFGPDIQSILACRDEQESGR